MASSPASSSDVTSSSPVEALPRDVLEQLGGFLLGHDLLRLAHASPRLLRESAVSPELWAPRLLSPSDAQGRPLTAQELKRRYCETRCLRFLGSAKPTTTASEQEQQQQRWDRGAGVPLPGLHARDNDQHRWSYSATPTPLSFDLWFSVASPTAEVYPGGIILGAQSDPLGGSYWPHYHQQFVSVDVEMNLYCSVIDGYRVPVATKLEPDRWYHLALSHGDNEQRVYLDGRLLHSIQGPLHSEFRRLHARQLGSGCISAGTPGKPTLDWCGWYPFHGLIAEFRSWHEVLTAEQIARLASGDSLVDSPTPVFALSAQTPAALDVCGIIERGHFSQPLERLAMPTFGNVRQLRCEHPLHTTMPQ